MNKGKTIFLLAGIVSGISALILLATDQITTGILFLVLAVFWIMMAMRTKESTKSEQTQDS